MPGTSGTRVTGGVLSSEIDAWSKRPEWVADFAQIDANPAWHLILRLTLVR